MYAETVFTDLPGTSILVPGSTTTRCIYTKWKAVSNIPHIQQNSTYKTDHDLYYY